MVEEFLDQATKNVGVEERGELVAKLELVEDLLDIGREAIQIRLEVGLELVRPGASS